MSAAKRSGTRQLNPSQPSFGNLANKKSANSGQAPHVPQTPTSSGLAQTAQPDPAASVLAIYLFEHDDPTGNHYVFFDEKQVFVIPTQSVSNLLSNGMAKGLTYKVFPSTVECTITTHGLLRFDHVLLLKIEVPTFDDYKKAPYFHCRVTVSRSTDFHANFCLLATQGRCNVQVPFEVMPEALRLKGNDELTVKVAFTTRTVKTRESPSLRRRPHVEAGFFALCDSRGEVIPAPLPRYSLSPGSIIAVKDSFMANLIVGVPEGFRYGGLSVSNSDLVAWRTTASTPAKTFLSSLASHLRCAAALKDPDPDSLKRVQYFDSYFANLLASSKGRGWGTPSSPPSSSASRPTVVFFLGFSDALSVLVAESLALDLHRCFGISSRIVAPAALGSTAQNFDELNSPRASPLAKTLFMFSEHLQLGLLDPVGTYHYDEPGLSLPFFSL